MREGDNVNNLIDQLKEIEIKLDETMAKGEFEQYFHHLDDRKNIFLKLEKFKTDEKIQKLIFEVIEKDKKRIEFIEKNMKDLKGETLNFTKNKNLMQKGYYNQNIGQRKKFDKNG
jgi:hypothetical protein